MEEERTVKWIGERGKEEAAREKGSFTGEMENGEKSKLGEEHTLAIGNKGETKKFPEKIR